MASRQWSMAAVLFLASMATAAARIQGNSPALAVRTGNGDSAGGAFLALSVTGTGFGAAPSGLRLHVDGMQSSQRVAYDLASTDQRIVVWKDVQIVAKLPPDLTRARATVIGPTDRSARLAVRYFSHESYDTAAAAGPNGPPSHIAVDQAGRVWVNPEFKNNYYYYDPISSAVVPALYPVPMDPPPFQDWFPSVGCVPSRYPAGGEGVVVDDRGRVWLPESGPAMGPPRDHGRVFMYDPPNSQLRVYDLPGDQNGFLGITWDARRRRIWVSQTDSLAYGPGSTLVSFDPERVPFETFSWTPGQQVQTVQSTFAFATTATCDTGGSDGAATCSNAPTHACQSVEDCVQADLFCPPGVVDDSGCYHAYPVGVFQPAHVVVHPDGHVWFTEYSWSLGSHLGRLDPSTGAVELYPLSPAPFSPGGEVSVPLLLGYLLIAPWDIQVAADGSIVATEFAANRIALFSFRAMRDTTLCQQLSAPGLDPTACESTYDAQTGMISLSNSRCSNPCIQELTVPGTWIADDSHPPLTHLAQGTLLTIALDRQRNIWFNQGYLDRKNKFHLWPPLLDMTPTSYESAVSLPFDGIGGAVAVDPWSGDIWGADYLGRRLNRLHPEP